MLQMFDCNVQHQGTCLHTMWMPGSHFIYKQPPCQARCALKLLQHLVILCRAPCRCCKTLLTGSTCKCIVENMCQTIQAILTLDCSLQSNPLNSLGCEFESQKAFNRSPSDGKYCNRECQYTTFFSSLMFCRTCITGGCQVLEVFDPFCFFSSWSHHGHELCLQRDIGLSPLKKIGFGHWIHLLSIAVGSGVRCLTIAIALIISILRALGVLDCKSSSKVSGQNL